MTTLRDVTARKLAELARETDLMFEVARTCPFGKRADAMARLERSAARLSEEVARKLNWLREGNAEMAKRFLHAPDS